MPAANSLRYNILPSNIPGIAPDLDGEAAFIINGFASSGGTDGITLGTPFTTTSFANFLEITGVSYAATNPNAILPEYQNNNLILQAKAFYDLAGAGSRAHWLVLDSSDSGTNTLETIFNNVDGSPFRLLASHAQYRIRLVGVSFSRKERDLA